MNQSAEGRPDESHVARHALAAIIALTYKMQPHSMLNPTVPLQMADAILAAVLARAPVVAAPSATADWRTDEAVRVARAEHIGALREMIEARDDYRGRLDGIELELIGQPLAHTLDALCDAVAATSRSLEPSAAAAGMTQQEWDDITPEHRNVIRERFVVAARAAEEGRA